MTVEPGMFAAYDPDGRRRELPVRAEVRVARIGDVAACARLVLARNGGDVASREARLTTDVQDPEVLVTVAVVGEVVGVGRVGWMSAGRPAASNAAPDGYYLTDLVVDPAWRRHGVGHELTRVRLGWVWERAPVAWFFANARNQASLALHEKLGFTVVTDDFSVAGVSFTGGRGLLCRAVRPSDERPDLSE